MKVKELYTSMEKGADLWSFSIWSEDGMEQLGLANNFYNFDDIADNVKNAEIINFKVGYNSLSVKIKKPV